jgi:hypothetical protein
MNVPELKASEPAIELTLYLLFSIVEVHQPILRECTLSDVMCLAIFCH